MKVQTKWFGEIEVSEDKIITFEYIHYMAKSSPKPEARKLYTDYQKYRKQYFSNPR